MLTKVHPVSLWEVRLLSKLNFGVCCTLNIQTEFDLTRDPPLIQKKVKIFCLVLE